VTEIHVCGGDSSRSAGGVGQHQHTRVSEMLWKVSHMNCEDKEATVNGATQTCD
jgi:hypothetical protein